MQNPTNFLSLTPNNFSAFKFPAQAVFKLFENTLPPGFLKFNFFNFLCLIHISFKKDNIYQILCSSIRYAKLRARNFNVQFFIQPVQTYCVYTYIFEQIFTIRRRQSITGLPGKHKNILNLTVVMTIAVASTT